MLKPSTIPTETRMPIEAPLRSIDEIDAPDSEVERLVRVASARLLFLDHELLAHDLPALSDSALVAGGHDPIRFRNNWLLENAGLISTTQAEQSVVNTPIRTEGTVRRAWRPPRYGRAVVVEARAGNGQGKSQTLLLDVKGAGIGPTRVPRLAHHGNGLCSLREALREILFEAFVSSIFASAAPDLWTVSIYGAIDLGFDIRTHRGETLPAGLLVRRAHRRPLEEVNPPARGTRDERLRLEIELLLRAYGLTSTNAGTRYRLETGRAELRLAFGDELPAELDRALEPEARAILGKDCEAYCDGTNVQLVRMAPRPGFRAQLVDFGHYEVRRDFEMPLVSLVRDRPHRWGACILPTDPAYVRPHPTLHAPLARWEREASPSDLGAMPRAVADPPTRWAGETAQAFRSGRIAGEEIAGAIRSFARWN
ncbi:MAG TPA: hypothetical protein VIT38_03625 [Allosphingosinicella sp.]